MSKPFRIVVALAAFVVGGYVARLGIDRLRREPSVSKRTVEIAWVAQPLGASGYVFDVPWPLEATSLSFPPEVTSNLESSTVLSHEADGLHVMAMHLRLLPGRQGSLEGAAEGSIANMRSVPGTASVNGGKHPTTVLGLPGFEVEARIERKRGGPLQLRGLVFGQGAELTQLQLIANADQPSAQVAWNRLRDSLRRR